jgi:hypothetical protein
MLQRLPTSVLSATGLVAAWGVVAGTGSRPLGGVVLVLFGLACIAVWLRRGDRRTALCLTVVGIGAFVASHALGLVVGAWPAVVIVAAMTAAACWRYSDSLEFRS